MSKDIIYREIASEIEARLNAWQRERDALSKAAARIAELDVMIAEAQTELGLTQAKIAQVDEAVAAVVANG